MKIAVVGTGYVGLVTGACFASLGHKVICVDIIPEKVDEINKGFSPIYEQGLEALLKGALSKNLLRATTDLDTAVRESDVIFICVGTPSLPDGSMSYEYVESAAKGIAKTLKEERKYKVIIIKSTCIPGTTVNHVGPILEKESGLKVGKDFGLGMNPEFLREGVAVNDFFYPDRVVIGAVDDKTKDFMMECYNGFVAPFVILHPTAAEMIKYCVNSFLATKISFINEMANLCENFGIDIKEVSEGMGMDHRISEKFLRAGAGWGGSCFGKDVRALLHKSKVLGIQSKSLQSTLDINLAQPLETIRLLKEELDVKTLKDKSIAVLGIAFKPETDDIREAPAIKIINHLLEEGALVKATDPVAIENAKKVWQHTNLVFKKNPEDVLKGAEGCILVTEWKDYVKLPAEIFKENMRNPILIDGRRVYDYHKFREKGIIYRGIGLGK